jgi:hypothetical protein
MIIFITFIVAFAIGFTAATILIGYYGAQCEMCDDEIDDELLDELEKDL